MLCAVALSDSVMVRSIQANASRTGTKCEMLGLGPLDSRAGGGFKNAHVDRAPPSLYHK